MFIIGIYVRVSPPVAGAPIPPFGYVALTCIFLFAAFFQFGWGPCCWIIVSEIPTARLRAMNVALAAATQWLFNFVVAQAVPHMMKYVSVLLSALCVSRVESGSPETCYWNIRSYDSFDEIIANFHAER